MSSLLLGQSFVDAGSAIEEMVAVRHPESSNNWADIEPMDDKKGWGLILATWASEAQEIVDNFNRRIAPRAVTLTKQVIVNSGAKPLDQFQTYLAAKADIERGKARGVNA